MKIHSVLFAFAVLAASAAHAAQPPEIRKAIREAQRLQAEGYWTGANQVLEGARQDCENQDDPDSCSIAIEFALGFVADRESDRQSDSGGPTTQAAESHYREVLKRAPSHIPALNNLTLLYERLGNGEQTESLLASAADAGAGNDGDLHALLGDFYRRREQWALALAAYERAADRLWSAEHPRRAIVEIYSRLPVERLSDLNFQAESWETRFPDVAGEAYRSIVERLSNPDRPLHSGVVPMYNEVIAKWVELLARTGQANAKTLGTLPDGSARTDILKFLSQPLVPPQSSWWYGTSIQRNALAAVALALGKESLATGAPQEAMQRWEAGRMIAPDYGEYQFDRKLARRTAVRLELERELVLLYSRNSDPDSGHRKIWEIMTAMVGGKGGAYQFQDLESILRFHTTLGIVCAQMRICDGTVVNTQFQLRHAIETAAEIEGKGGAHQPLQEVKRLLAETHAAAGEQKTAQALYLDATEAALDEDQIYQARLYLEAIRNIGRFPDTRKEAQAKSLERIIATRLDVENFRAQVPQAGDAFLKAAGHLAWIGGAELPELGKDFIGRQRFKTLSDLATRFDKAGQLSSARRMALRAFGVAVDGVDTLMGKADLDRLEATRVLAIQPASTTDNAIFVKSPPALKQQGARTWKVHIAQESPFTTAWVGADLLLAYRVRAVLASAAEVATKPVRVRRGDVNLFDAQAVSPSTVNKVRKEVLLLPGSKAFTVEKGSVAWGGRSEPSKM